MLATFTDFVELSGDFSVERVVTGGTTTLQLAASSVGAFLGVQRGQADVIRRASFRVPRRAGDRKNHRLRSEICRPHRRRYRCRWPGSPDPISRPHGAGASRARLGGSRTADIPDLDGTSIPLNFSTGDLVNRFGGNVALDIDGFTTLSGAIGFEKQTDNGTTEVRVAGTDINAFLGRNPDGSVGTSDDVGRVSPTRVSAPCSTAQPPAATSYAVDATGAATLVGVDGFSITGNLAARINTTGGAVSETIIMPSGSPVVLTFGPQRRRQCSAAPLLLKSASSPRSRRILSWRKARIGSP
ncbi:MAG UNVERIFIED_CONTAM: hypothetical protein LVR18_48585 [Planctomycetaceae bacterium]